MPHSSSPSWKHANSVWFLWLSVEVVDCGWSLVKVVEALCAGGSIGSLKCCVLCWTTDPLSLGRGHCGQWLGMLAANLSSDNEHFYWQRYWKHSDDDATPRGPARRVIGARQYCWQTRQRSRFSAIEEWRWPPGSECSSCIISFIYVFVIIFEKKLR